MSKNQKVNILFFLIVCLGYIIAAMYSHYNGQRIRPEYICNILQQRFIEKEGLMERHAETIGTRGINNIHQILQYCEKQRISPTEYAFYVYEEDTLKAWSSNVVHLPSLRKGITRLSGYQTLDNTHVFIRQYNEKRRTVYGICVLESPFIQKNTLCDIKWLNQRGKEALLLKPAESRTIISDKKGRPAFAVEIDHIQQSDPISLIEAGFWLIALALLISFLHKILADRPIFKKNHSLLSLLLILICFLFLFDFLYLNRLDTIFSSKLFSSLYYSSFFSSLGGLFMGSCILLMTAVIIVKNNRGPENISPFRALLPLTMANMLYIASFIGFREMIRNTSVSVLPYISPWNAMQRMDNPLLLKLLFAGSLCVICSSVLIVTEKYYRIFFKCRLETKAKIRFCIFSALLVLVGYIALIIPQPSLQHHPVWIGGIACYAGTVTLNILHNTLPQKKFSIRYHTFFCLIATLLISFLMEDTNYERRELSKESFANSLLENKNPLIQYNLREISHMMETDDSLGNMLSDTSRRRTDVIAYMQNTYVLPYLENYRKKIFVGRTSIRNDLPQIREYERMFRNSVPDSLCPSLAMTWNGQRNQSGNLMLKMMPSRAKNGVPDTVCIAINTSGGSDFFKPNYLLNRNEHRLETEMTQFACAEYDQGRLTSFFDPNNLFHRNLNSYGIDTLHNGMHFRQNHTDYYIYYRNQSHIVMLATQPYPLWQGLSVFPYLFLLAILLNTTICILVNFKFHQRFLLFKQRIQLLIVLMILLTAIIGGIMFIIFTQRFSKDELFRNSFIQSDMIMHMLPSDKLCSDSSNIIYLENKLMPALSRIPMEYVENTNIYSLDGEAVFMLDKNLPIPQSPNRLNPKVIEEIQNREKSFYRDIDINRSLLLSNILYKPIEDSNGEIVAYLSFPSRQKGGYIDHLFATVLPAFLCIYLLITLMFALFGSLMGRYLMVSLTQIADFLSKVKLHSENQKIDWKYDDEIGMLVRDYNRLVDDLEVSAEMLARSERESSWKELAQQVAHEIKNPLTPMKLSVQQLQRRLNEGKLDKEQLEKYIKMMVEQIDALTDITSSFSSMAKIHQGFGSRENLLEILSNAMIMFEPVEDVFMEIKHSEQITEAPVWIDKEQLLRVFNNLIKNAIQAKKEGMPQHIVFNLTEKDNRWQIAVTDYGKGMDEEQKRYAFTPHFTTKSGGSGLGLAIVKNILYNWGGSIRFESVPNDHTTFYLLLPKHQAKA